MRMVLSLTRKQYLKMVKLSHHEPASFVLVFDSQGYADAHNCPVPEAGQDLDWLLEKLEFLWTQDGYVKYLLPNPPG